MDTILNYWWLGALAILVLAGGYYLLVERRKKIILVWHENQKVPATLYGDYHFGKGKYRIKVCLDPNVELKRLGEERVLIYHFH